MYAIRLALLAVVAVAFPLWGQGAGRPQGPSFLPPPASQTPLVLRNVTVIDVRDGTHLADRTVMVVGNRIRALGAANVIAVPAGARVVEAKGKFLVPGLWDLHVHPHRFADLAFPLFIANGVTTVRDAGSEMPLTTLSRWKREIAAGRRVGPRLLVSGPALDGPQCGKDPEPYPYHDCVTTPAEARLMVDMLHTLGADMIKTYSMDSTIYFAVAAEARRIGVPFGGHAYVGGLAASDSGATFLDHQTWLYPDVCGDGSEPTWPKAPGVAACAAAAARLRRNHTWVTVYTTMGMMRMGVQREYMPRPWFSEATQPFQPASTADWVAVDTTSGFLKERHAALARMHEAGIPMVVGTDVSVSAEYWSLGGVPGFGVAEVLVTLVLKGGMTPLEALQTATLNAAAAVQASDSLGTVETGKVADLVVLDADPLTDIWNTTKLRGVVANGRYYDRRALDGLLQAAAAATRAVRAARQAAEPAATGGP